MALADALSDLRSRLETAAIVGTVVRENENTRPPHPPAPWILLEFIGASSQVAGIAATGQHLIRSFGTVLVHVLVPRGTAVPTVEGYADQVAALFTATDAGGVFYDGAPRIDPTEPASDDGVWFGRTVAVDFRHDWTA